MIARDNFCYTVTRPSFVYFFIIMLSEIMLFMELAGCVWACFQFALAELFSNVYNRKNQINC